MIPLLYRVLFTCFPKRLFSSCLGKLASASLPAWLLKCVIRVYAGWFRINLGQFEKTDWQCFNEFFVRTLRPEARKLSLPPVLSSPCDGKIIQGGTVNNEQFLQIKNQSCSLGGLWGANIFPKAPPASAFESGKFLSIYLSPRDYHRFHLPCDAQIKWLVHMPGDLWTVSPLGLRAIPGLFLRNERIALGMNSSFGQWIFIAIAATGVSNIQLSFSGDTNNQSHWRPTFREIKPTCNLKQNQELGKFLMGSSLMLVFPPNAVTLSSSLKPGKPLLLGQKIGAIK